MNYTDGVLGGCLHEPIQGVFHELLRWYAFGSLFGPNSPSPS